MSEPGRPALPRIAPYDPVREDEIPASRAPWTLETDRAALLVHDMQDYFLRAFAPDSEPVATALRNIAALASAARARGVPVFYTAQRGDQLRADRGLQADLWGPGMRAIPEHEAIHTDLTPRPGDTILRKHRYSAFQRSDFEDRLRAQGRDQLIVTGVYAHIGCALTAAEAFQRDIHPFLVADALADFSRARHLAALDWAANCCAVVLPARKVLEVFA